jgi:hypothetical protein
MDRAGCELALAEFDDGAVEIDPFVFHFDVSLVHAPRSLSGCFVGVGH